MSSERARAHRSPFPWTNLVYAFLSVGLIVLGLYLGYVAYATIRDFAAHTPFRPMPILPAPRAPSRPQPQPVEQGQPSSEQPGTSEQQVGTPPKNEIYPELENKDRVNILFLGIDQRPGEVAACRTDTMILVSVNPADMSASLLSIPRDLWVPIPPNGREGRINTAHYWGEIEHYPGGGPALAKHTVRYNLGVPVHYYVRLNFTGFQQIIDSIGGIDVDVPVTIDDDKYPSPDNGYQHLHIEAGRNHFDGEMALKYARTRRGTGDGDFTRMQRQQQVILAVRDRVLSLPNLPQLIVQLPQLARNLGESLETDVPPDTMFKLAKWAQQIDGENIRMESLDRRVTTDRKTEDGQSVLIYDRERARPIIESLFNGATPEATATEGSQGERLESEDARIAVYNGTNVTGLAQRVAHFLSMQGIDVVSIDNADRSDYEQTTLSIHQEKPVTQSWLISWLADIGVPDPVIAPSAEGADVHIVLVIGSDFPVAKFK
jgi:LCP family protein required for cell wall assembly